MLYLKAVGQVSVTALQMSKERRKPKTWPRGLPYWPDDFYLTFLTGESLSLDVGMTNNIAE
jgi:hypothetical protein